MAPKKIMKVKNSAGTKKVKANNFPMSNFPYQIWNSECNNVLHACAQNSGAASPVKLQKAQIQQLEKKDRIQALKDGTALAVSVKKVISF